MLPNGKGELISGIRAEISPDLTGVGYIIGPRVGGYLLAGGAILWMGIAELQAWRKDESFTVTPWLGAGVTLVTENAVIAIAASVLLLAVPLYRVARRRAA